MKVVRSCVHIAMAPKSSKAGKKTATTVVKEIVQPQAINVDKNGDFAIKILAKPGSKEMTELISYLSKLFGIRKSDLSLDRGSRSRIKTVTVSKDSKLTLETLNQVVQSNIGK